MRDSKRWAVACGLVVALAVASWVGSMAGGRAVAQGVGSTLSLSRTWPPAPSDIVSLPSQKEIQVGTSLGIPGYLYFEVPKDRALVITDMMGGLNASNIIYEDLPGKTSVKISVTGFPGLRSEYHSAVGAAFAPGSKVVLLNYTTDIHLTGYLTAP